MSRPRYRCTAAFSEQIAGAALRPSEVRKREFMGHWFEVDVPLGNDHTVTIRVDRETAEAHPEMFEPVGKREKDGD